MKISSDSALSCRPKKAQCLSWRSPIIEVFYFKNCMHFSYTYVLLYKFSYNAIRTILNKFVWQSESLDPRICSQTWEKFDLHTALSSPLTTWNVCPWSSPTKDVPALFITADFLLQGCPGNPGLVHRRNPAAVSHRQSRSPSPYPGKRDRQKGCLDVLKGPSSQIRIGVVWRALNGSWAASFLH